MGEFQRKRFAFERDPNLLMDKDFVTEIQPRMQNWRDVVAAGLESGIPLPAMSASLSYFEALRRKVLPANIIQAQRDFFGAHTYMRRDMSGTFHTQWEK